MKDLTKQQIDTIKTIAFFEDVSYDDLIVFLAKSIVEKKGGKLHLKGYGTFEGTKEQ